MAEGDPEDVPRGGLKLLLGCITWETQVPVLFQSLGSIYEQENMLFKGRVQRISFHRIFHSTVQNGFFVISLIFSAIYIQ